MAGAPLVHSPSAADEGRRNVGNVERLASGVVGGLLVAAGIRRRSYPGIALALLGGELVRRLAFRYDPPGGPLGDAAARLFGGVPDKLALRTLRRLKSLVETGEVRPPA